MHAISEMLENGHFLTNSLSIVCKYSVHGNITVVICRDGMKLVSCPTRSKDHRNGVQQCTRIAGAEIND